MAKSSSRFSSIKNFPRGLWQKSKSISQKSYIKSVSFIHKWPILSVIIILTILLILIALSNTIFKPKVAEIKKSDNPKEVRIYQIGKSPTISTQAIVEKSGVVKIVALSGGVVNQINVKEGQIVDKGTNLGWISSSYEGGNISSAQRQLAQAQYNNVLQTFDTQKDLINKQREVSRKNDDNNDNLRDISSKSSEDSNNLINLNQDILNNIDKKIKDLESSNVGGINDDDILQNKQLKSQFQSANNQLRTAQRNTDYTVSGDKTPSQLSDLQRDIALKQLDIQEKALNLQKEVSRLQVVTAQIQESLSHPVSPFPGKVDRIYAHVGDAVNPGTPLFEITGDERQAQAVVLTSKAIAESISFSEPSQLTIGNYKIEVLPINVSNEPTDGNLHSVIFSIPEEHSSEIGNKSYVKIDLTLKATDTSAETPCIPVDSVYQSQSEDSILIAKNGKVTSKKVTLGEVTGGFVEVTSGITDGDQVILDRNVIAGDKIKIIN